MSAISPAPRTGQIHCDEVLVGDGASINTETITIAYDAGHRPIRIVRATAPLGVDPTLARDRGRSYQTEHRFEYDCASGTGGTPN